MAEPSDREPPVPDPPPGAAAAWPAAPPPDDQPRRDDAPVWAPPPAAAGWAPPGGAAAGGPPPAGWAAGPLPYRPREAGDPQSEYPPPPPPGYPPYAPPGWTTGGTGDRDVRFYDQPDAVPRTRGDAWMWLLYTVIGYVAGQVAGAILTVVAAALAGDLHDFSSLAKMSEPPEWFIASGLIGLWFGFFLGPLLASMTRGTRHLARDVGLRFRVVDLAGLGIGLGGQILVAIMYAPFAHHLKNLNGPTNKLTGAAHGGGFLVIALLTVIGAPFFEELFFRGLLLRALLRLLAPARRGASSARALAVVGAVVLDGLLFGLAHAELVQLAGLATFGAILAFVSYRTGRLGMNIVAHGTFNLIAVLAVASSRGLIVH